MLYLTLVMITIPASLPLPFTKSSHFAFMPQFDHNHSIGFIHILNSISDFCVFSLHPHVLQHPSLTPSSLNPTPTFFVSQSADAKSLRDPAKIKAMRLQVGRALAILFFSGMFTYKSNKGC